MRKIGLVYENVEVVSDGDARGFVGIVCVHETTGHGLAGPAQ